MSGSNRRKNSADNITYNNSVSGLTATNVQAALDELAATVGLIVPMENVYVVAKSGADTNEGTFISPFLTISKALAEIGEPTTAEEQKEQWTIIVAPGRYDEDITLPAARIINIVGLGPVVLGDGAGGNFSSTTPRTVTIDIDDSKEFGVCRPSYQFATLFGSGSESTTTHPVYRSGFDISGDLVFNNIAVATTIEFGLIGTKVRGSVDGTAAGIGGINSIFYNCFFDTTFDAPSMNINVAKSCEFDGPMVVSSLGRMVECEMGGDITFTFMNNYIPPFGIFDSYLNNVNFITNATVYMDEQSYYYYINNSGTITGSGSVTLTETSKANMTEYDNSASGLVGSTVQAALDELAARAALRYVEADADATSAWNDYSVDQWNRTIPAATHLKGLNPVVIVYDYETGEVVNEAYFDDLNIDTSGNIDIRIPKDPDGRFRAQIIVL